MDKIVDGLGGTQMEISINCQWTFKMSKSGSYRNNYLGLTTCWWATTLSHIHVVLRSVKSQPDSAQHDHAMQCTMYVMALHREKDTTYSG